VLWAIGPELYGIENRGELLKYFLIPLKCFSEPSGVGEIIQIYWRM
jgi:hypothetical protein